VALRTPRLLIAECGLDMSQFPTGGTSPRGPESSTDTANPQGADDPNAVARGPSGATSHDLLIAHYYIARDEVPDLSSDQLRRRHSHAHRARRLALQIEKPASKSTSSSAIPTTTYRPPNIPTTAADLPTPPKQVQRLLPET
jgi:hypothetical protein